MCEGNPGCKLEGKGKANYRKPTKVIKLVDLLKNVYIEIVELRVIITRITLSNGERTFRENNYPTCHMCNIVIFCLYCQ